MRYIALCVIVARKSRVYRIGEREIEYPGLGCKQQREWGGKYVRETNEGGDWRERLEAGGRRDEDGVMQSTHASSPPGGVYPGRHKDKEAQVEVDRLAAAPRKTLNRNPAGKIACSQWSQGKQPSVAYGSSTCSRPTWRCQFCESRRGSRASPGCRMRQKIGPRCSQVNLGAVRGSQRRHSLLIIKRGEG